MKKTLDELLQFVNDSEMADDIKISMMEDISDSFEEQDISEYTTKIDELTAEIETLTNKVSEVTEKYKKRFLEGSDDPKPDSDESEDDPEEFIDVKEI